MSSVSAPPAVNPLAISLGDAAKLLSRVGNRSVSETRLRADVEAGAPTNADGTINLLHYAAWLLKEAGRAD